MTPLPWAAEPDDREGMEWNVHIVEAAHPHVRVAFTSNGPDSEANAAFIVNAVNNHEAMDKLLAEAADYLNSHPGMDGMDLGNKITEFRRRMQADLIRPGD